MEGQDRRHSQTTQLAKDHLESLRVIDILGPVEGREDEGSRLDAELGRDRPAGIDRWHQPLDGFDDRVPGLGDAFSGDALRFEVLHGGLRRGKAEVGQMVGEDSVVFLGHRPIETSKPRLYVYHGYLVGVRRKRPGCNRVRISLDYDARWSIGAEQIIEFDDRRPDLSTSGRAPDTDVMVGRAHPELLEEHLGQGRVIVLAGVDDQRRISKFPYDARELDDLRSGSEHDGDRSGSEFRRWPVHAVVPVVVVSTLRSVMLRLLVLAAQIPIVLLAAYNAIVALWGWRNPVPARRGSRSMAVRVVVPAHDEETVVPSLLTDLSGQDYPKSQYQVVVIADRCNDRTAEVARKLARPVVRSEGEGGKGAALAWYLAREPLDPGEALIVLDADNRVEPSFISLVVDELEAGAPAIQCYLDVSNPDASPLATASALSYWASNRMVQLARTNLGWSCDLGGTGMAFTSGSIEDAGGFTDDLVEDQALGVRLALAGHVVRWLHHVRIRDEKPTDPGVTIGQRARWMAGKRAVAKAMTGIVFTEAVRKRSFALADLGLRLRQPSRMFLAFLAGILGVAALVTGSPWLLRWEIWFAVVAIVFVMPLAFLWRDRVPWRYLIRYPLLVLLALLWIPIRLASGLVQGRWGVTPHTGSGD